MRTFAPLLFFMAVSAQVIAQDTTNTGTDFWIGYGHHQFMQTGTNSQELLLYFRTGAQGANVTVTIDSSGTPTVPSTQWKRTYSIPANTAYTPSETIPKSGQYDARLFTDMPPVGTGSIGLFRKKGIHVQSDVPIAVYAHIYGSSSSGATMVLPVQAWGYTYYSMNSKQVYASNTFSWLFVIAREDSTVVEITPSVKTRLQNQTGLQQGLPTTVLLQKGQIYQIMGANDGADANGNGGAASSAKDLTGTKVRALVRGRPVAVFAGSSRTSNPASCGSGGGDNDIVQLFPLHVWGRRYLTAPTSGSAGASSAATNVYRVVVYDPTTVVKRNGVTLANLVNNGYYTFESNTADYIEADKPVLVGQFPGGANCNPGSEGDPDFYLLSPIDGGIKATNAIRTNRENISVNYATLIVPTAALSTLRIDNSALFDHSYPHPQNAAYTVVVKRWPALQTQFTVQCDSLFTGITYGLGPVESYGFNIGARFNPLQGIDPMYKVRWTGTTNSDWTNPGNWSSGSVPTADEHVYIQAGAANNPVIGDGLNVTCQSVEVETGASLTVKPSARLTVLRPSGSK